MQKENDINLKEEVAKRYEQLHPDLKAALISVDTAGAVYEIGKKFGLNIEKTGYLADVIGYTVIGLLPVANFMQNLKDTLEVDAAKAEEISREVNTKIFLAIREQLKKTHGEKWDERALRQPTTNNLQPTTTPPTIKPTTDNRQPTTPMTPKSPWEIKPDGFGHEAGSMKHETERSVIPPALRQPTTNNQQPTTDTTKAIEAEAKKAAPMPPEPPKTREAPQPAPVVPGPKVLSEITPLRIGAQDKKPEVSITKPVLRDETAKTAPPENLPFAQEVEKLVKTPELEKPQQPLQEVSITKPVVRDETKKSAQPIKTPEKRYELDPYREPIE